jgi:hypothetical protein
MSSQHQLQPSPLAHSDQVLRSLNEAFYAAEPAAYMRTRLTSCMRAKGTEDGPGQQDPSSLRNKMLSRLPGWEIDERTDPAEEARSLVVEAFGLAHHAGEVLLRHVLAQLDAGTQHTSPWLALAKLQQPREFRRRCKALINASDEELDNVLDFVFLPHREQATEQAGEEKVAAARKFLAAWVRHFARYFIDTANGYNGMKHGLSSLPGHAQVSFYAQPEDDVEPAMEVLMMTGAILETLESEKANGTQEWMKVMRGVDPPGLLACVAIAISLIEWLWSVGLARHTGEPVELPLHDGPLPADVRRGHEAEWGQFRRPIAILPLIGENAQRVLQCLGIAQDAPQEPT